MASRHMWRSVEPDFGAAAGPPTPDPEPSPCAVRDVEVRRAGRCRAGDTEEAGVSARPVARAGPVGVASGLFRGGESVPWWTRLFRVGETERTCRSVVGSTMAGPGLQLLYVETLLCHTYRVPH